jgi:hypothetical protein
MWIITEDGALVNLDHVHQILISQTADERGDCLMAYTADDLDEGVELTCVHEDNDKGRVVAEKALAEIVAGLLLHKSDDLDSPAILVDFRNIG